MNRRLYYIFPSISQTKSVVDELLLKRINIKHMHVMAKDSINLGDLPEASLFQKYDIKRSLIKGIVLGGFAGVAAGIFAHIVLDMSLGGLMFVMTLLGVVIGAWSATMIGMMVPNTEILKFLPDIDAGKILLMLDIAKERVDEIESALSALYPDARFKGEEPTIPSFP